MKIVLLVVSGFFILGACTNRKWEEIKPKETAATVVVCDTSYVVSYSAHIGPILISSCGSTDNNCHTSYTASAGGSGGVSLDNYTGVQDVYAAGRLYGCLTGDIGFSQMPKPSYTLSACNKTDILRWINAGAPNN